MEPANLFTPSNTPTKVFVGAAAAAASVVLVASSVWRRRLRLSYELWQVLHTVLAAVAVVAALVHVLGAAVRHVYLTRIALATSALLLLACLAFAAIQN
ncbi:MAG TPA: ferric reductase-like transmembrane domain-containing protein [Intrasporangium sp.]|uniref:ferric reductase-like transmembrane domain-containing protein n=1 Tax=Intrasporangium sp. TaxID=1925024 RepID=UPI002F95CE32